jgi:hypothetical protein
LRQIGKHSAAGVGKRCASNVPFLRDRPIENGGACGHDFDFQGHVTLKNGETASKSVPGNASADRKQFVEQGLKGTFIHDALAGTPFSNIWNRNT